MAKIIERRKLFEIFLAAASIIMILQIVLSFPSITAAQKKTAETSESKEPSEMETSTYASKNQIKLRHRTEKKRMRRKTKKI